MKTKAKLRKLTQKDKSDIWGKIEWEGGLEAALGHGAILSYAEGTDFEPLLRSAAKALEEVEAYMRTYQFEEAHCDDDSEY